jgi:hypothetical protein
MPTKEVYVICMYLRHRRDCVTIGQKITGFIEEGGVFSAQYELTPNTIRGLTAVLKGLNISS